MISSKYIDIRLINGKWVSLVQCCNKLPLYITHESLAEALESVTDFAEGYLPYIENNGR